MAKVEKDPFRCAECGWTSQKWVGRCGECQAWGSVEEIAAPKKLSLVPGKVTHAATPIGDVDLSSARARATGVVADDDGRGGFSGPVPRVGQAGHRGYRLGAGEKNGGAEQRRAARLHHSYRPAASAAPRPDV